MIYNVVLVSAVQQSESLIHIHISTVFYANRKKGNNYKRNKNNENVKKKKESVTK